MKTKIICTLGPSSFPSKTLKELKNQKIDIFRINLSHTKKLNIEKTIKYLLKQKIKNICIDTEGAQIRTTSTKKKHLLKKNTKIKVFNDQKLSTGTSIHLYPKFNILKLKNGTLIDVGFNNLKLKVISKNLDKNYLICNVEKKGMLESNKGVHINSNIKLNPLTEKDIYAIKLGVRYNLKYYAISFVNSHRDLEIVRRIIGKKAFIISKIETKNAVMNLNKISKNSDAILIDRGDLSRYVPIEKIPYAQEIIIKKTLKTKVPTYVATNLLETMIKESQPTRAESHDIYSTLKQGAKGLVLAAETAIGTSPIDCVKFLKRCIKGFHNQKKNKINYLFYTK